MEAIQQFNQVMKDHATLALATINGEKPNVRVLSFVTDAKNNGLLYFATFKGRAKEAEFALNDNVAFTTITNENPSFVRVQLAKVKKSEHSIHQMAERFIEQVPVYEHLIANAGDALVVYEIHFSEATVTVDNSTVLEVRL